MSGEFLPNGMCYSVGGVGSPPPPPPPLLASSSSPYEMDLPIIIRLCHASPSPDQVGLVGFLRPQVWVGFCSLQPGWARGGGTFLLSWGDIRQK